MNLDDAKKILSNYLKECYNKESHHIHLAAALSFVLGLLDEKK